MTDLYFIRHGQSLLNVTKCFTGSIAIATHATPIRAMEAIWRGLPLSQMKKLEWAANASVTHVRYEGKRLCELVVKGWDQHLGTTKTILPAEV